MLRPLVGVLLVPDDMVLDPLDSLLSPLIVVLWKVAVVLPGRKLPYIIVNRCSNGSELR